MDPVPGFSMGSLIRTWNNHSEEAYSHPSKTADTDDNECCVMAWFDYSTLLSTKVGESMAALEINESDKNVFRPLNTSVFSTFIPC